MNQLLQFLKRLISERTIIFLFIQGINWKNYPSKLFLLQRNTEKWIWALTWKAETGTERVCLKSSRWAMEWIEEQFDSLESVLLSIPLGSNAGFCLKLTALFLRLSVLNIRWGYLHGDFGASISNPKLSSPPGCLWMSFPRSRSLLENRRNNPPNPLDAGSSNFGIHFFFFLVSWESSMMVWRSKGVP